jgi:hypothetical protein
MIVNMVQSLLFAVGAYATFAIPAVFLIKEAHISKIGKKRK